VRRRAPRPVAHRDAAIPAEARATSRLALLAGAGGTDRAPRWPLWRGRCAGGREAMTVAALLHVAKRATAAAALVMRAARTAAQRSRPAAMATSRHTVIARAR